MQPNHDKYVHFEVPIQETQNEKMPLFPRKPVQVCEKTTAMPLNEHSRITRRDPTSLQSQVQTEQMTRSGSEKAQQG